MSSQLLRSFPAGRARLALLLPLALALFAWGLDMATYGRGGSLPWVLRQESLNLSGVLAISMMSLAMLLSSRPTWLETPLGGMDRIYQVHKWAGILAGVFAVVHWTSKEVVGDILKATIGKAGKVPKEHLTGFFDTFRDLAKDFGEWAFYALLVMVVIALWQRFPYRPWRWLHRAMPVLYLMLVFHAVLLAPGDYWREPLGLVLLLAFVAGVYGALLSLLGLIGRSRRHTGEILALEPNGEVLGVRCQLAPSWPGHEAGQFALVDFSGMDPVEGAHPFTLACADRGNAQVEFQIKALGDCTSQLRERLQPGQEINIEGPYGRFLRHKLDPKARQVWIAGGIGITPFLAWLEDWQSRKDQMPAVSLHYATRDSSAEPFVPRLLELAAALPSLSLRIHDSRQGQRLSIEALEIDSSSPLEIWFCGPQGLAEALRAQLEARNIDCRWHQEVFQMR
jgi:predicted ferric reductase